MESVTKDVADLMRRNVLEVFNERDADRRRQAIGQLYAQDAVFYDPEGEARGHDAINAGAQRVLDGAPGLVFTIGVEPTAVHDLGRISWQLGPSGGAPVARGTDIGVVHDGRLQKLYTFLE